MMLIKSSLQNRFKPWVLILLMLSSVVLLTLLASDAQASAPDTQEVYISEKEAPLASSALSTANSSGYALVAVYTISVALVAVGVGYIITVSERKNSERNKAHNH